MENIKIIFNDGGKIRFKGKFIEDGSFVNFRLNNGAVISINTIYIKLIVRTPTTKTEQ